MVFFYNSIVAQLLLNGYFVFRIDKSKPMPKGLKIALYILIAIEALIYFSGLFFREQLSIPTYALIQKISAFWVISSLYFLFLLSVFDLVHLLNKKWIFKVKLERKILFIFECVVTLIVILLIGQKVEISKDNFINPDVKEFSFQFDTLPDSIPSDSITAYKLLTVSDLHLGYLINKSVLKKYVDVINSLQPDIIVVDGDLIDYYLAPLIEERMDLELKKLKAPHGVYFVPGNHEYKVNPEADFEWIRSAGITVLKDSIANIDDKLYLIGWDDRSNEENRASLKSLFAKVPNKESCILFAHQPKDIKEALALNIPLTISGHTHNGQFFPANLISFFQDNFYGLQQEGDNYSYTTSGLGLSGMPVRIVSQSEIAVFNIEIK
jgi:Predicted phosphohydrolases